MGKHAILQRCSLYRNDFILLSSENRKDPTGEDLNGH